MLSSGASNGSSRAADGPSRRANWTVTLAEWSVTAFDWTSRRFNWTVTPQPRQPHGGAPTKVGDLRDATPRQLAPRCDPWKHALCASHRQDCPNDAFGVAQVHPHPLGHRVARR